MKTDMYLVKIEPRKSWQFLHSGCRLPAYSPSFDNGKTKTVYEFWIVGNACHIFIPPLCSLQHLSLCWRGAHAGFPGRNTSHSHVFETMTRCTGVLGQASSTCLQSSQSPPSPQWVCRWPEQPVCGLEEKTLGAADHGAFCYKYILGSLTRSRREVEGHESHSRCCNTS